VFPGLGFVKVGGIGGLGKERSGVVVLESERMSFRPHELADFEAYFAMEADAEVRRYVGGAPRTREAAEMKFQSALQPALDRMKMWATVLKANNQYIGRCGVYPQFQGGGSIAGEGVLGFYLARAYWGQGLASEAGLALVKFGFGELGLNRIVSAVEVGNTASVRVLGKLGFHHVWREEGKRSFDHFELMRPGAAIAESQT
jgi:ribosomal-protein-alanine N-acetyltransferase